MSLLKDAFQFAFYFTVGWFAWDGVQGSWRRRKLRKAFKASPVNYVASVTEKGKTIYFTTPEALKAWYASRAIKDQNG